MNDITFRPFKDSTKDLRVTASDGKLFAGVSGLRNLEKAEIEKELLKVQK
jgi:hypothetical protein